MSVSGGATRPRAGILVTGTEVLTGIISDRNGPWLSERLREIGVDAYLTKPFDPGEMIRVVRELAGAATSEARQASENPPSDYGTSRPSSGQPGPA